MKRKRFIILLLTLILILTFTLPASALPADSNDGKTGKEKNVAPQISFQLLKPEKPVDIIIMTDYTGQDLANLQASANNLKATLIPQNYGVNINYLQDTVKVGTTLDYLRRYYRYAHFTYKWNEIYYWNPVKSDWLYNEVYTSSSTVETAQVYETQEHTLPNRSNARVTGWEEVGWHSSTTTDYVDVRLYLSGDVRSYVDTSYSYYYESKNGDSGRIFEGWSFVSYNVDRSWTPGEAVNTAQTDLNILDASKIVNMPLRANSTRYLLIATKGVNSTGTFTTPLQNYINTNNIKVKASINEVAHDWMLTQENFIKDVFACNKEIYYLTRSGRLLRTGADSNSEFFVDVTDQFPGVTRIEDKEGNIFFYSGSYPKYVKGKDGVIRSFPFSHSNIADIKYYNNYAFVYMKDKKLYDYYPESGSYKLLVNRIDEIPSNTIYRVNNRTINGIDNPSQYYGISKITVNKNLINGIYFYVYKEDGSRFVQIMNKSPISIPNIKQIQHFGFPENNTYAYDFVLTTDNKLYHLDVYYSSSVTVATLIRSNINFIPSNSNYDTYSKSFTGNPVPLPSAAQNFKNIYDVSEFSTIYENMDGTVQYMGISSIKQTRESDHGEHYWVYTIVPTGMMTTSINGIKKIETYYYIDHPEWYPNMTISMTYILDNSNVLWVYSDGWNRELSYRRQLKDVKTDVEDFALVRWSADAHKDLVCYTLQKNKTVFKNYNTNTGLSNIKKISAAYTDPRTAGEVGTVAALKEDGTVVGTGQSAHWQLGQYAANLTTWVNPLTSRLTIDNPTLPYIRMNDLVSSNPGNLYYAQGNLQPAFDDIVKDLSYNSGVNQAYLLLNEPVDAATTYIDYENDPERQRRWIYTHDSTHFENSLGINPNAGKALSAPLASFSYVGKYDIELQARDNPKNDDRFDNYRLWSPVAKTTIYVHRRPVAKLRLAITPASGGLWRIEASDAGSYDLDHYSAANHGIASWEWRWKEETEANWHNERMVKTNCDPTKRYIVQLRVKDLEGVWSDWNTAQIDDDNPPVALFSMDKNLISLTDTLKLKDQSYVQSFATLTNWHWIVKKLNADGTVPGANLQDAKFGSSNNGTGGLAGYDANVKTSYSSNGVGTYRLYLRVKDSAGMWSDGGTDAAYALANLYTQDIRVDAPPVARFTIDSSLIKPADTLKLKDTSYITGISPIVKWHWIVKKLNADGSVPGSIQDAQFGNRNGGTGTMAGYDVNVKTSYSDTGAGNYRIYLRVMNANGMWSDSGTDSSYNLGSFYSRDLAVDSPPTAQFSIANSPFYTSDLLKLRDTSYTAGISAINRWHWIVKKLNADGSVPGGNLQNAQFANSNNGTGALAGYDANVKTNYESDGPGTYRIYLRVRNGSGMWSDGGTDAAFNLDGFYYQDLAAQESYKLANFRVTMVRDLHLESFYKNAVTGDYAEKPFYANQMALDARNFNGMVDSLARGYLFEFAIDTVNFNEAADTLVFRPHFYTCDLFSRDGAERDVYWETSRHEILKAGEGGHEAWRMITLTKDNRTITGGNNATWRGSYLIPATAWAVPKGTLGADAKEKDLKRDIIVNFEIKGYKSGVEKFDYNVRQWPVERTTAKYPYQIGDVIRYNWDKSCLDDVKVHINRP